MGCSGPGVDRDDTHRKLDRREFQGFALVDRYAPLIFVNGADFKAAQMFTLAHELAHVFVGATGVSNVDATSSSSHDAERFCNSAAAEFLVSEKELTARWSRVGTIEDSLQAVARRFTVSVLVAAHKGVSYREAYAFTGLHGDTFDTFVRSLDVATRSRCAVEMDER